ncbi:hypothetical protein IM25_22670 [Rhodococcus sp. p52]|uniref:hypothetical protein n=1 Tax=Rhodococcus sp. p52 TaxID=935199 RepID=UPI00051A4154|nr:hypothetical protein [Rhodococcus sp. p52]AOD24037.1 hypothetical protein IM25_22670 [Rhodococcus sp. p52]
MAQTLTGFKGIVDEQGEARRFTMLAPPVVAGATDLAPSSVGTRTIRLAAGVAMAGGVRFSETSSQDVVLPANTSGQPRWDLVGLRFTWGSAPSVTAFSKQGVPAASPSSPPPTRTPGVVYEMVLAVVYVRSGVSTIAAGDVYDARVWAGVGGPYRASQANNLARVDLPVGAEILVGAALYQVTAQNTATATIGVTVVDPQTTAWKAFVPNLWNSAGQQVTASTFWKDGRYRIADGVCRFKVRIALYGTIGGWTNPDGVAYGMDLPVRVGAQLTDQWAEMSLMYPSWPWIPGRALLRENATRALLYVAANPNDVRIRVMNGRPEIVTIDGSYLI